MCNQLNIKTSAEMLTLIPKNCYKCPAGYYSDVKGLKHCKPCPLGHYNDQIGQLKCKKCNRG